MSRKSCLFVLFVLSSVVLLGVFGCAPPPEPLPEVKKSDLSANVKDNQSFSLDIYKKVGEKPGNVFLSPYSIYAALSMATAGAAGDTAQEMKAVLHHSLSGKTLHETNQWLLTDLNNRGNQGNYKLAVANQLWGQKAYPFVPEFLDLLNASYRAGLQELDFEGDAEEARNQINQWVEKQTNRKIKDLMPPGSVDQSTRLALTNAIYFKGDWLKSFKKSDTASHPFTKADGSKVDVPMMEREGKAGYVEMGEDGLRVLQMDYKGEELSMVALLPEKGQSLADLEKKMTSAKLDQWLGAVRQEKKVLIRFPKFRFTKKLNLREVLMAMGMKKAFSSGEADFSGINGKRDLFIQGAFHKAFVDVNEEGTEAAAATGFSFGMASAPISNEFIADRPFLFLIRDNRTKNILFLGRIAEPVLEK